MSGATTINWKNAKKHHKDYYFDKIPYACLDENFRADREITIAAVSRNGLDLKHAPQELRKEIDIVIAACFQNGWALQYASEEMKSNKEVVLVACSQNGWALEYASEELKNNKEVVLAACSNSGEALPYASEALKNDKEVVLAAFSQYTDALEFASEDIKNNKEVLLVACSQDFRALQYASKSLQENKEVVLAACSQDGWALKYASKDLWVDKEVILAACSRDGDALYYASEEIRNDKEVVLLACSTNGGALKYASEELKNDKDIVLAACSQNGYALCHASESLRADKEVVMTAVESQPMALQYGQGGLNQDKDCLIKAGLWDEDYIDRRKINNIKGDNLRGLPQKKIVLSTKFSLAAKSSTHATKFTLELKKHPYIKGSGFVVYSPNAFNKGTCDPNWTNNEWPCRGTYDSCQKPHHLKHGVPQETECCWRYSFRYQLVEARRLGGFMIQVVDLDRRLDWKFYTSSQFSFDTCEHTLGDGQKIETEMANDVGVKIFRFFEPPINKYFHCARDYAGEVSALVSKINEWHNSGCNDMQLTEHGVRLKWRHGKMIKLPPDENFF